MKVVILAGGLPSSISEEKIPKPMLKIGERPLLWHIMKLFSMYGYDDFLICTGFHSELIKDYFLNYYIYRSDITVDLPTNEVTIHNRLTEPWKVTIADTGLFSSTAGRIKAVESLIDGDFIVTYGDCISDINVRELTDAHRHTDNILTLAVAKPSGRSTILPIGADGKIRNLCGSSDKESEAWANACTMVASPKIFDYIPADTGERFEAETVSRVSVDGKAGIYKHSGFWLPVETVRDKSFLERKWQEKTLPWRD